MSEQPAAENPWRRMAFEMGPLLVFLTANFKFDIYVATAAFMVAISIAVPWSWIVEKRMPVMPLVTAGFVLVFGALTLWLHDDTFIKVKPTIVNLLFASILFVSLLSRKVLLKYLLGTALSLTDEGWRILTFRWGLLFVAFAVINEIVWRTQSTDFWVNFKVFGFMTMTIIFMMFQMPMINRHQLPDESE